MSAQKASLAVNSGASIKKSAVVEKKQRLNLHSVIVGCIEQLKAHATPEDVELCGQKIKKHKSGFYKNIAEKEYIVKDGKVLPELSELGIRRAVHFYNRTGRWVILESQRKGIEAKAKELKLEIKTPPA